MQTREFLEKVRERSHLPNLGETEILCRAVLGVLAERMTQDEARGLAEALPAAIQEMVLERAGIYDPRSEPDLIREIAAEQQIPEDEARRQTRDVLHVVSEAVGDDHLMDLLGRLPDNLRRLFPARYRT
ncbi:DUF2267 domain-containing protein [Myxococcota bacterium]|nr:DUF2267 domain-containing protein [Myxococcota bacterium]